MSAFIPGKIISIIHCQQTERSLNWKQYTFHDKYGECVLRLSFELKHSARNIASSLGPKAVHEQQN